MTIKYTFEVLGKEFEYDTEMTQSQWDSLTEKEKMWHEEAFIMDFLGSDVLQLKLNGELVDMNSIDW